VQEDGSTKIVVNPQLDSE